MLKWTEHLVVIQIQYYPVLEDRWYYRYIKEQCEFLASWYRSRIIFTRTVI